MSGLIVDMVDRALASGRPVATTDFNGYTLRQIGRALQRLRDGGKQVHCGVASRRNVRYSYEQGVVLEWARNERERVSQCKETNQYKEAYSSTYGDRLRAKRRADAERIAPWDQSAPAHYPVDADGKPTYKITICPPSRVGTRHTSTHAEDW